MFKYILGNPPRRHLHRQLLRKQSQQHHLQVFQDYHLCVKNKLAKLKGSHEKSWDLDQILSRHFCPFCKHGFGFGFGFVRPAQKWETTLSALESLSLLIHWPLALRIPSLWVWCFFTITIIITTIFDDLQFWFWTYFIVPTTDSSTLKRALVNSRILRKACLAFSRTKTMKKVINLNSDKP